MRFLLIAMMLTFATQADAWFDIFAKEKYLFCTFKDSVRYKKSPQTFVLKGNKVTKCSVQDRHGLDKLREQKVSKTSIYVKCQLAHAKGSDYVDKYYIDRVTGKVELSSYSNAQGTIFFEGFCYLRDSEI